MSKQGKGYKEYLAKFDFNESGSILDDNKKSKKKNKNKKEEKKKGEKESKKKDKNKDTKKKKNKETDGDTSSSVETRRSIRQDDDIPLSKAIVEKIMDAVKSKFDKLNFCFTSSTEGPTIKIFLDINYNKHTSICVATITISKKAVSFSGFTRTGPQFDYTFKNKSIMKNVTSLMDTIKTLTKPEIKKLA